MLSDRFSHTTYQVRKKVLQLFGGTFHVYDPSGSVVFYSQMKKFKLKEDIRLYTGEDMQTELLTIKARQIFDFSAAYDVIDSVAKEKVGALKRQGMKSLLKDEWIFMNAQDQEVGRIREDSTLLALIRRFLIELIPQTYFAEIGGALVARYRQNFNPFVTKIDVDFSSDPGQLLDRRLGIAAAILLCGIEGKQD